MRSRGERSILRPERTVEGMERKGKGGKYAAAVVCGVAAGLLALIYVAVGLWMIFVEPIALPILLLVLIGPAAVLFGAIYVTLERIKEIKGGEEDDSRDY